MQQRFYGSLRDNNFFGITALNPVAFLTNTIGICYYVDLLPDSVSKVIFEPSAH